MERQRHWRSAHHRPCRPNIIDKAPLLLLFPLFVMPQRRYGGPHGRVADVDRPLVVDRGVVVAAIAIASSFSCIIQGSDWSHLERRTEDTTPTTNIAADSIWIK